MTAKQTKPRKAVKFRPPEDQLLLKTQCGFCEVTLPDPSTAQHHLAEAHPGEYV